MSSNSTLRWASVLGTMVLALISSSVVATSPKPAAAPLHPAVTVLPSDAPIHTESHVS
jgi:hypothetical protein